MTMETWTNEYYIVDASDAVASDSIAIAHSRQKWQGLSEENLAKHGLRKVKGENLIYDPDTKDGPIVIGGEDCALCCRHNQDCNVCPFVKVTGESCITRFDNWAETGDTSPMMAALDTIQEAYPVKAQSYSFHAESPNEAIVKMMAYLRQNREKILSHVYVKFNIDSKEPIRWLARNPKMLTPLHQYLIEIVSGMLIGNDGRLTKWYGNDGEGNYGLHYYEPL